jgi:hypothetical protein
LMESCGQKGPCLDRHHRICREVVGSGKATSGNSTATRDFGHHDLEDAQ